MSRRHSDSKRRHSSRFDTHPTPSSKRHRRDDGEEERERVSSTTGTNGEHRQLNELKEPPKHSLHNKPNEPPKHAPKHDERGSAGQVGRSSGQRQTDERGWWKDSKNQLNERTQISHGGEQRVEKSQAKLDDNTFQRKNIFSERKNELPPTSRKRPAFREKKFQLDSGDANLAAVVAIKSSQIERNDRKEERSGNPQLPDRPEKHFADDRAHNKTEARRNGFPSRGRRYGGNDSYRGRDIYGGRQGYRSGNIRTEKWKHDLYQEVNKDPIPQNEDDQIAKLEALLAS
ncbi:hypothetical protein Fmac_003543 [Flemingia macrophylla]|uniref:Btz domain-containing protein n=1 Tax=Flemingia macrophylla TaxID=520843 RepID=A0ABD1NN29_9FABA